MALLDRLLATFLQWRVDRRADQIKQQMERDAERCVTAIQEKWLYYNRTFKWKEATPLAAVIEGFSIPITEYVAHHHKQLFEGRLVWMMIFAAIQRASTHPQAELDAAIETLQKNYTETSKTLRVTRR
jgi:hypothetical protein